MATNRKLQAEIDRVLKRVTEGIEEFDQIWEKVHAAPTPNLKDKYEADLKKEIKKLQRYRDQIKSWASSSDVKNKAPLLDARKDIENEMERFKVLEKETKTKAYSKEGLSQSMKKKKDPKLDPKYETYQWIEGTIRELKKLQEGFQKAVPKSGKKGKKSKQDPGVSKWVERHQWHIEQLNQTKRRLEKNELKIEHVEEIKDGVEYYLESNQDPDFFEDEELYNDLDEAAAAAALNPDADESESEEEEPPPPVKSPPSKKDKKDKDSNKSPKKREDKTQAIPTTAAIKATKPAPAPKVTKTAPTPKVPAVTTPAVPKVNAYANRVQQPTPQQQQQQQQQQRAAPAKQASQPTPTPQQLQQQQQQQRAAQQQQQQQQQLHQQQLQEQQRQQAAQQKLQQQQQQQQQHSMSQPQPQAASQPPSTSTSAAPNAQNIHQYLHSQSVPLTQNRQQQPSSQPSQSQPSQPASNKAAAAPSGQPASSYHDSYRYQLTMLEPSFRNTPDPRDSERPNQYAPRNPYRTPSCFPSIPAPVFDDPAIFEKFSTDTLFFIFYFQQGTPHQYLAARELKKQSWRYHKNFLTWFQRHDEPKLSTEEYEQGTYVYFDYESGWCQQIKTDFTFEYCHLEDELWVPINANI